MAPKKTYILAPSLDYKPGDSIALGNVIADPFSPHRPLCHLPADKWPRLATTLHKGVEIAHDTSHGVNLCVGAELLNSISAKVAGEAGTSSFTEYSTEALRTEFFEADPDEEAVRHLLAQSPRASRALLSLNSVFWPQRLFMITGLKITVGLRVSSSQRSERSAELSANPAGLLSAQGMPVSMDAGVSAFTGRGEGMSFTVEDEVILAYRLLRISPRGWRRRELQLDEYRSSDMGRMLSADEEKKPEERVEIDVVEANEADVLPDADQGGYGGLSIDLKVTTILAEDDLVVLSARYHPSIHSA